MPLASGLMAFGSGILGDVMSYKGQQATNANNVAMMMQNEQWQEHMSDTAMQRRVEDLKKAGLNPMLAVGGPGASMGTVSQPNLQNPAASMANLGQQTTSAMQLNSQINAANAAANSANADAELKRAQADSLPNLQRAQAGAAGASAEVSKAEVEDIRARINNLYPAQAASLFAAAGRDGAQQAFLQAQLPEIVARIRNLDSQSKLNDLQGKLTALTEDQQRVLFPALKTIRDNEATTTTLGLKGAENENNFQSTFWGYLSHHLAPLLPAVNSGVSAAAGGALGSALGAARAAPGPVLPPSTVGGPPRKYGVR